MVAREITVERKPMHEERERPKLQAQWWLEPDSDLCTAVWGVVDAIEERQKVRATINLVYASMYENVLHLGSGTLPVLVGVRGPSGAVVRTENVGGGQMSSHNVVRSCVDTAGAKISKNNPRVKYATSEGSWTQQQRARKLTQYTDALFREGKAYEEGRRTFRDACVWGLGALHVFVRPGTTDIMTERVMPLELIVDDEDGAHGKPRQLHRKKRVSREELMAMFPEFTARILEASSPVSSVATVADPIDVLESWHLRSGAKAKDGRHTISIENCTLLSEPWEKDYFPFVFYRWADRLAGFWGMGIAEEIAGIQLKINRLDKMIDAGIRANCVPRCFVPHGAVASNHKLWDFGAIAYKGSVPPTFSTAPGMAPEVYAERDREVQYAYQMTGVSQLSASSQKPAGLNSGAALREYQDQNSERFSLQGERWEQFFVQLAAIMLDMSRDLARTHKDIALLAKGRRQVRQIKLSDVLMEESAFVRQAFPVSQLPTTPEGRLQFVQELAQAGYIDREMALELLRLGDVDDSMSLLTAAYDDAMMVIDGILEDGEFQSPEPYMNLTLTLKLAQSAYLRAKTAGAPRERLELLRTFMEQIVALQTPPAANNVAPGVGAGQPLATPQAAPTSDLLPAMPAVA